MLDYYNAREVQDEEHMENSSYIWGCEMLCDAATIDYWMNQRRHCMIDLCEYFLST